MTISQMKKQRHREGNSLPRLWGWGRFKCLQNSTVSPCSEGRTPETYGRRGVRPPQKSIPCLLEMGDDMGYHSGLCLGRLDRAAGVYMGGELLFKIRLCFWKWDSWGYIWWIKTFCWTFKMGYYFPFTLISRRIVRRWDCRRVCDMQ